MGYQDNYLPYHQMLLGHNVQIFTSNRYFPFEDYEQRLSTLGPRSFKPSKIIDKGIIINRYRTLFENSQRAQILFGGYFRDIYRFKPEVVQVHSIQSLMLLFIPLIKLLTGAKIFVDSHSDYNVNPPRFKKRIFYKIYSIYIKIIDRLISGYLPITSGGVKFLKNEFNIKNKVHINYLGSDLHINNENKFSLRKMYKLPLDGLIFVTSGLIDERKKIKEFLLMMEQINTDQLFYFLIVGTINKEYLNEIKDSISVNTFDRIILKEFVKSKVLYQYYFASDIAFFPGRPTVSIQEAMGCSLPVIIRNHEETRQLHKGGVLIIENNDDNSKKIKKLINDKSFRNEMSKKSIELITDKFTWNKIAIDSIELYKTL